MKKLLVILFLVLTATIDFAQIKVVTSLSVIYDLVNQIGKDKVKADYICRGDQDPHDVEVMPSYMLKLRNADLFIEIGLGLEMWAPQLIDGSRNNKIKIIDLSKDIDKKEVPTGKVDASQGDVHPYGNPHYWLDPENIKIMAKEILDALSDAAPDDKKYFQTNYNSYISRLDTKIKEWNTKMAKVKGKSFVFFHSSWIYFADRYGIKIAGYVEPKPGIPPAPSHNAELFKIINESGVKLIVMENYYSDNAPRQIAEKTGVKILKVPVMVFGYENIKNYFDMMDFIVNVITQLG
jgi:zinc/manganese transport system substrate-binding protein